MPRRVLAPQRRITRNAEPYRLECGAGAPRVHLFHGARMPWNLYEHDRLMRLTQRPWFNYTPVISDDTSYPGTRGLSAAIEPTSPRVPG